MLRHARRVDCPGAATGAATGVRASLPPASRRAGPADHWRRHDLSSLAQARSIGHGRGVVAGADGEPGMRVLVVGRMERDPWTDNEDQPRETWQVNARSVGILPYRIESVALSPKPQEAEPKPQATQESTAPKETKRRK
ncbi:hypothetical protein FA227_20285 [Pseudomonas aeruginosa]|nr:hypothetical protein [Pseudomonas aeruginosa]MCO3160989.1 hypothetical protein [Pseudomonas aeruginosa]